mmetsp:Transcript_20392/g.44578  ORF Transcript_20392/g.44578 Transcript_20392/m.44578 type:complete len:260 (+) Transcript_20392:98-877(+)
MQTNVLAIFVAAVCITVLSITSTTASNPRRWFLTFQDTQKPGYVAQSKRLAREATEIAKFDEVIIYKRDDVPEWWWELNKELLADSNTLYNWAWKPFIIFETLMKLPEGDVLWYMDTMYSFLQPVDHLMANLTDGMRAFCNKPGELHYTVRNQVPKEVLQFMLVDERPVLDKDAFWAGCLVLQKTPKTLSFVSAWAALAGQWSLVQPRLPSWNQDVRLIATAGDQTVLSPLAYKYGFTCEHFPKGPVQNLRVPFQVPAH